MKFHGLILLSLLVSPVSRSSSFVQCHGCDGSGTSDSDNCGTGTSVSIEILCEDGTCTPVVYSGDPPIHGCGPSPCTRTVTRTWSGLPPNTPLQFCRTFDNGVKWCIDPPPSTGPNGSDDDTTVNGMNCNKADSSSIEHSCGASATAYAVCSPCPE